MNGFVAHLQNLKNIFHYIDDLVQFPCTEMTWAATVKYLP